MSKVISRVTIVITYIRGLMTPLITTHEPPSMVALNPKPLTVIWGRPVETVTNFSDLNTRGFVSTVFPATRHCEVSIGQATMTIIRTFAISYSYHQTTTQPCEGGTSDQTRSRRCQCIARSHTPAHNVLGLEHMQHYLSELIYRLLRRQGFKASKAGL